MPHIIGITGTLGAGKTTAACMLPWLWKNKVEALGGSLELFANSDVLGATLMQQSEDWYKVALAHGSVCIWDEAHRTFDSRKWSDYGNTLATELLTFVRKMAAIQVFATPSVMRLDTRIREIMEILIVARNVGRGIYYDFYDYQADFCGKYGRYLHSLYLPAYKMKKVHSLNLFDSEAFVNKFPMPQNEAEGKKFMLELEAAHQEGRRRKGAVDIELISSTG